MIKVFNFDVYAFLDPGANLYFVTPYVEKKFWEPSYIYTPVWESILADIIYRDCSISMNHKNIMNDIVELYMVDFDVTLGIEWLHACMH